MPVLRLIPFAVCRECVSVARYLLHEALRGELRGVAVCWWRSDGQQEAFIAGVYHTHPEHALGAADLIKVKAGHQMDLFA